MVSAAFSAPRPSVASAWRPHQVFSHVAVAAVGGGRVVEAAVGAAARVEVGDELGREVVAGQAEQRAAGERRRAANRKTG